MFGRWRIIDCMWILRLSVLPLFLALAITHGSGQEAAELVAMFTSSVKKVRNRKCKTGECKTTKMRCPGIESLDGE